MKNRYIWLFLHTLFIKKIEKVKCLQISLNLNTYHITQQDVGNFKND